MSSLLDARSAPAAGGDHRSYPGAAGTVLVVDDDDAVRAVAARYLRHLGYSVIAAADAVHALGLTTPESRVDLVLSDIALPGMRGPALLRELRSRWPSLRTVLMTGYAPEALHPVDWPPDTGFLTKPFAIEELRECLARQLGTGTSASPCAAPDPDQIPGDGCCDPTSRRRQP